MRFEYLVEAASWFSSKELGSDGSDADNEQVRNDSNRLLGAAKNKNCLPQNIQHREILSINVLQTNALMASSRKRDFSKVQRRSETVQANSFIDVHSMEV